MTLSEMISLLGVVVSVVLVGMGGAMGWFKWKHQQLNTRLDAVEGTVSRHVLESTKDYSNHTTQLAVIQTCQEETKRRLEGIEETTRDTNQKLDTLVRDVITAIQRS